jgi:hypothetical protein
MYSVDLWPGACLTAEQVLTHGFKCARTVPLTVAFISMFSIFEVILEGMKLRGCVNHEYALTLTSELGHLTNKLTDGKNGRSGGQPLLSCTIPSYETRVWNVKTVPLYVLIVVCLC